MAKRPDWLPEGWAYTPTQREAVCPGCGHRSPEVPGNLRRRSDGRTWPLIGNKSASQERKMVESIVAANGVAAC